MKNIYINCYRKVFLLCGLCTIITPLNAQEMTIDDVNFDVRGMIVSKTRLESGEAVTSFKLTPQSIDSYSEQIIVGIVVVTAPNGGVIRVDPVMHELKLPSLDDIISDIENNMSIQRLFDKHQFKNLTEVQRMGFLRRFSVAIIAFEGNRIRMDLDDDTKKIINMSLANFELTIENNENVSEMRKWARLILRKVKFS